MIVLLTGSTGAGKTAKIVQDMQAVSDRPFFVMGIKGLKLPHVPAPPVKEWVHSVPTPEDPTVLAAEFTFPPNAIVVIDEAQHVYRPRAAGSKVPDIVAAFETHRHCGIDFWLITQHPSLLDQNVRRLVKKHIHIHETPLGRKLLEWSECRDPSSKTDRADAIAVDYKPPKAVFELYHSAEAHTVLKRRLPKALFVVVAAAVLFVGLAIYMGTRIKNKLAPVVAPAEQGVKSDRQRGGAIPEAGPVSREAALAENPLLYMTDFIPRHIDYPESAPAYDAVRVVKTFPVIVGCIKTDKVCRCISQQGTDVQVTPDRCLAILAKKVFDPYREVPPAPQQPEVLASVGDSSRLAAQGRAVQEAAPAVAQGQGVRRVN
jgi:zona occludens toxin